jgi:hypothetical protein
MPPARRRLPNATRVTRNSGRVASPTAAATKPANRCWRFVRPRGTAGERGVLLCVALDQRVAKVILDYVEAAFEGSPILKQLIANRTASLDLTNGISLEVRPASFRKLRGPTYIAVIADELAFWYDDAAYANPDPEVLNAVEPGLATTGGPLILASSRSSAPSNPEIPPAAACIKKQTQSGARTLAHRQAGHQTTRKTVLAGNVTCQLDQALVSYQQAR